MLSFKMFDQDALRALVIKSLEDFVEMLEDNCHDVLEARESFSWDGALNVSQFE